MTLRTPRHRFATALVLLLTTLLLPGGAGAAAPAAAGALADLYEVARLMDAAVLDFNMLLGEDQSPTYKTRLDGTLLGLEQVQQQSPASLAAAGVPAASISSLDGNVSAFRRLMQDNRRSALASGAPEGALVDEMMQKRKEARDILDGLYTSLEKSAGLAGSPLSEARALALQLQQMSSLYVETAAAAGGVIYRSNETDTATIDGLARSFAERLTKLGTRASGKESAQLVHGIESKWRFIEKSMLNYRERTVPFLVDRYTQAIVTDLLKLADALERGA